MSEVSSILTFFEMGSNEIVLNSYVAHNFEESTKILTRPAPAPVEIS
jgi:hypothetical protein